MRRDLLTGGGYLIRVWLTVRQKREKLPSVGYIANRQKCRAYLNVKFEAGPCFHKRGIVSSGRRRAEESRIQCRAHVFSGRGRHLKRQRAAVHASGIRDLWVCCVEGRRGVVSVAPDDHINDTVVIARITGQPRSITPGHVATRGDAHAHLRLYKLKCDIANLPREGRRSGEDWKCGIAWRCGQRARGVDVAIGRHQRRRRAEQDDQEQREFLHAVEDNTTREAGEVA